MSACLTRLQGALLSFLLGQGSRSRLDEMILKVPTPPASNLGAKRYGFVLQNRNPQMSDLLELWSRPLFLLANPTYPAAICFKQFREQRYKQLIISK